MALFDSVAFYRTLYRKVLLSVRNIRYNRVYDQACIHSRTLHHLNSGLQVSCFKPNPAVLCGGHLRYAHNNKGWKVAVKNRLAEDEREFLSEDIVACEAGTEAVPHDVLMSCLQDCSSVMEQIDRMCLKVSLSKEDIQNRKDFAQSLHSMLQPFFPELQISVFGSSINGFGFKGCDCDVSIDVDGTLGDDEIQAARYTGTPVEIPTVAAVESGSVPLGSLAKLPPRYLLRFMRRVFRQYSKSIREPILFIRARHPILRFYDQKHNVFCDFSLGNNASLRNTRVIRFIGMLDDRVLPLIKLLRYWGKYRSFIGDTEQFNSYAFSLLVVYFLQNTTPAVIPPVAEMMEKSGYLLTGRVTDDELMYNDLKKFTPSPNTQSVEELLKEFFFYYMYFDFTQVLCPLTSSSVPKWEFKSETEPFEFSSISIQDPFRRSFNVGHAASGKSCSLFLKSVLDACRSYQKKEIWVPASSKNWGISILLDTPPQEQLPSRETELVHTVEIPAPLDKLPVGGVELDAACKQWLEKASQAVVDILQYGLLFECKAYKIRPDTEQAADLTGTDPTENEKLLITIRCSTQHNVFSGRSNFQGSDVKSCSLETEHNISLKVSERRSVDKRSVNFDFVCRCIAVQKNDVPVLLVSMTFQRRSFQPAVAVFLKENLAKLVRESL